MRPTFLVRLCLFYTTFCACPIFVTAWLAPHSNNYLARFVRHPADDLRPQSPSPASIQPRRQHQQRIPFSSQLAAKKKKGGEPSAASSKKMQVKLLKHVPGTGQAGEVVMVTPPFFNNKLRPTKSAVVISDEELAKERQETNEKNQKKVEAANAIRDQLEDEAYTLTIQRKAGPDGRLYGGVGPKVIMEELQKNFSEHADFLASKGVKISSTVDADGKKIRGDMKTTGEFGANVALTKDISAKVSIAIEAL